MKEPIITQRAMLSLLSIVIRGCLWEAVTSLEKNPPSSLHSLLVVWLSYSPLYDGCLTLNRRSRPVFDKRAKDGGGWSLMTKENTTTTAVSLSLSIEALMNPVVHP